MKGRNNLNFFVIIQIYDPWTTLGKVKKIHDASIYTLVAVKKCLDGGAESAPLPSWELGLGRQCQEGRGGTAQTNPMEHEKE